jgi:hypothetical protein
VISAARIKSPAALFILTIALVPVVNNRSMAAARQAAAEEAGGSLLEL